MLFSTQTGDVSDQIGIEKSVQMLIDVGFPCIDISMFNMQDFPFVDGYKEIAYKIRAMADSKGVVFNQAHAPFCGDIVNYTKNLVPKFPRSMEVCRILGVKCIVVHPLQVIPYYNHEEEMFEKNMEFYSQLVPLAKEYGVKIGIENMWQRHLVTNRICDDVCEPPAELCRYFDTLNERFPGVFTVCLDIGHVALCGREPEDAIYTLGSRIGALHVHDVDYIDDLHTLPGVGKLKWDRICKALADIDYRGEFTLEANSFFDGFDIELYPIVAKFAKDVAEYLTKKIEGYRNNK